jgi:hypothetical protein
VTWDVLYTTLLTAYPGMDLHQVTYHQAAMLYNAEMDRREQRARERKK